MEGAHAESMLYVFDEAKTINDEIFNVADDAMLSAGPDTGVEAFAFAISTPGEPQGRFYDLHRRAPGFEDWSVTWIKLEDGIQAGRVSRAAADRLGRQWGVHSSVYKRRVLGEFASSADEGVIPLDWVEAANERWHQWKDDPEMVNRPDISTYGVDVAYGGADLTVIAPYSDEFRVITEIRTYVHRDTMKTADLLLGLLRRYGGTAIVDIIGYGAGVYDRLKQVGEEVGEKWTQPFVASAASDATDETGELAFADMRSAGWWNLREMLNPDNRSTLALPPDDRLTGDLTAPAWDVKAGGKIKVEEKAKVKDRLGRSTDVGDAVMQACCLHLLGPVVTIGHISLDSRVSPWTRY